MSQQKMLLAVCLTASLVVIVSGQQFNPMQCGQRAQKLISGYTENVREMVSDLTKELSKQLGAQSTVLDSVTADANSIMRELSSLSDTSSGLDFQRIRNSVRNIAKTELELGLKLFDPSLGFNMVIPYTRFTSSLLNANVRFMSSVANECMPTGGSN